MDEADVEFEVGDTSVTASGGLGGMNGRGEGAE
jgi:hypothetical protein